MKKRSIAAIFLVAGWLLGAAIAGCAHLPQYAVPGVPGRGATPTPTPSTSPSIVPSGCGTQAPNATVLVAIAGSVNATTSSYGTINGYTTVGTGGAFGNVATVITARASDVVQFVDGDTTGANIINHSAVGFPGASSFPTVPYSFPASTQNPIGTAISQAQWSTGILAPLCFSQPLTLSPGTYYFGDYQYYNLSNMRDVIVVSS